MAPTITAVSSSTMPSRLQQEPALGQTKAKGRLAQPAQKKKPGGVTRPGFERLEKHAASTGCVGCRALYKAAAGGLVPKQEARLQPGFKESTHSTQFGHSAGRIP